MSTSTTPTRTDVGAFALTEQQVHYYEDFGFLLIRGLFADEIAEITEGFEEVFATHEAVPLSKGNRIHYVPNRKYEGETRLSIGQIVDLSPKLSWLRTDPRVLGIARSLLGDDVGYRGSDGNLMNCNVRWHQDVYGSPLELRHVKLLFYLDPLDASNGALRVIPGTHHWSETYATRLRHKLQPGQIVKTYGVKPPDIPAYTLEVQPGDVVVNDFRTLHGSFHGGLRRRLFTINFGEEPK